MKDKVVWIDQGWQPSAIGFIPSEKAWHAEMSRINLSEAYPLEPGVSGFTRWLVNHTTGASHIYVCIGDVEREALSVIMTIVHECVHVWQFLCEHMGEKASGYELEAYAIQHITEGMINAYCSTQGKGKKWPIKS